MGRPVGQKPASSIERNIAVVKTVILSPAVGQHSGLVDCHQRGVDNHTGSSDYQAAFQHNIKHNDFLSGACPDQPSGWLL
jgi:hypothetical protein